MIKLAGIYMIENTYNHKIYIGESENIEKRWNKHKEDLKNHTHHSFKLQNDYDRYGVSSFEFKILEKVELNDNNIGFIALSKMKSVLLCRESYYINFFDSINKGYNIENTIESILCGEKSLFGFSHPLEISNRIFLKSIIVTRPELMNNGYQLTFDDFKAKNPKKSKFAPKAS